METSKTCEVPLLHHETLKILTANDNFPFSARKPRSRKFAQESEVVKVKSKKFLQKKKFLTSILSSGNFSILLLFFQSS